MGVRGSLAGAALTAVWSLVLVTVGPNISSREALEEISGQAGLDYGPTIGGRFEPLSDEFIARVLGLGGADERLGTIGGSVTQTGGFPSVPARTVVEHALTNDDMEDAYPIPSTRFTARADATGASRDPEEPSASCAPTGDTIWFKYVPAADEGLIANTFGTQRPVGLAVFADGDVVRCHSNVDGNAQVAFPADADVPYLFQIVMPTGGGPVVFNLDPLGTTERVSVNSRGEEARYSAVDSLGIESSLGAMSADGRWIVFRSTASNLVDGDTNGVSDVFVHDRVMRETTRVSIASDRTQGNGPSGGIFHDAISADGRYVAFSSLASNLVDENGDGNFDNDDTNEAYDVFVHDRVKKETTRVSLSSQGEQGERPPINVNDASGGCSCGSTAISADGRFVAFHSPLGGLVTGDGPEFDRRLDSIDVTHRIAEPGVDTFVHDRQTGETTIVSVHSDGTYANGNSGLPRITPDGRYVAFVSIADNLVDHDTNGAIDVFVHDRLTGGTRRVSVDSEGREGRGNSGGPADISASGRYVAFGSWADLVPDDENGSLDVFVHDLQTGDTRRVSVTSDGEEQQGVHDPSSVEQAEFIWVAISGDGRFVAFPSGAPNLSPGRDDAPLASWQGIFVHDRLIGTTIELTLDSHGDEGRPWSSNPILSADGRVVAFQSQDAGLVEDDGNANLWPGSGDDVFVHTFPVLR